MKLKENYDEEYDIFSQNWGGKVNHSIEMFDGDLIIDMNKNDNVVGMEIFDFWEQIRKHNKKMKNIFFGKEKKK